MHKASDSSSPLYYDMKAIDSSDGVEVCSHCGAQADWYCNICADLEPCCATFYFLCNKCYQIAHRGT